MCDLQPVSYTHLVSAKSGSTVLAAVLPFAVIFLPALMLGDINTLLSNILGLLPDKLLQINRDLAYFDLYQLGDSVMGLSLIHICSDCRR